jgi:hypothetical protein
MLEVERVADDENLTSIHPQKSHIDATTTLNT